MLDLILKVLHPFHISTKQLSGNSELIIHLAQRTYNDFFNALESIESNLSQYKLDVKHAVRAAFDKMSEYYSHIYNKGGLFYNLSVMLNPIKQLTIYNVSVLSFKPSLHNMLIQVNHSNQNGLMMKQTGKSTIIKHSLNMQVSIIAQLLIQQSNNNSLPNLMFRSHFFLILTMRNHNSQLI